MLRLFCAPYLPVVLPENVSYHYYQCNAQRLWLKHIDLHFICNLTKRSSVFLCTYVFSKLKFLSNIWAIYSFIGIQLRERKQDGRILKLKLWIKSFKPSSMSTRISDLETYLSLSNFRNSNFYKKKKKRRKNFKTWITKEKQKEKSFQSTLDLDWSMAKRNSEEKNREFLWRMYETSKNIS